MSGIEKKVPPSPPPKRPSESMRNSTGGSSSGSGIISTPTPSGPRTVDLIVVEGLIAAERNRYEKLIADERQRNQAAFEAYQRSMQAHIESIVSREVKKAMNAMAKSTPMGDRTMKGLINRLFADRPQEKREAWAQVFDAQEVPTIDAAALLDDSYWERMPLPLGVVEVLKEAVRAKPDESGSESDDTAKRKSSAGQDNVTLTATTATTPSGCPSSKCDASFDFVYDSTTAKYTPSSCPRCNKSLKPPMRLKKAAIEHLGAKKVSTSEEIVTQITAVAAKSAIRVGSGYIPYVGSVVAAAGESAVDIAMEQRNKN